MKIAPSTFEHYLLRGLLVISVHLLCISSIDAADINCESDFVKPTIEFPAFEGLATGDTMFFVCSSETLGFIQNEAVISDNCDPNPLVTFTEQCRIETDCSQGHKYFADYKWTVVDNNNNVCIFEVFVAIGDKRPPLIELNWGEGISSGDTVRMECGYGQSFDESYVTVTDECDPSRFCGEDAEAFTSVFFQERIVDEGYCDDYLTKMICTWIARDACNNESRFELVVFLNDTTAPEFVDVPEDYCGARSMTAAEFEAYREDLTKIKVRDRCSTVDLEYAVDDLSNGCNYLIQWKAEDYCGNTSYHEQEVCIRSDDCNGQISGTVGLDTDQNLTSDEPIESVQLLLIEDEDGDGMVNGGEQVFMSTKTDERGFYSFENVPQGCYVIVEIQPSGVIDARDEDVTNPGDTDRDGANDPVNNIIPVCVSPGEFDDGNDFVEQQIILAIELSRFEAQFDPEENVVKINWETEYEYNSSHFLIERSLDGINFYEIGQVNTSGNKSLGDDYQFDDQLLTVANKHFYRLVEVDDDGLHNKSDIISVKTVRKITQFEVFPNPTNGVINIIAQTTEDQEMNLAELFTMTGELVLSKRTDQNTFQINMGELQSGTYMLRVNTSTSTYLKKIALIN